MTKILLAGATGLVGGEVLKLLLADERVSAIVAPTRRPVAAHPKLLNPIADSHNLSLDADWWNVDSAICALGTTRAIAGSASAFRAIDYDYALAIATRVRQGGARRFALTSSLGANPKSRFLYPRTKGELEEAVSALGFEALTIVRPGFLGGHRADLRPIERVISTVLTLAGPVLPATARISPAKTVAALLVEAAISAKPGAHTVTSAAIEAAATLNQRCSLANRC